MVMSRRLRSSVRGNLEAAIGSPIVGMGEYNFIEWFFGMMISVWEGACGKARLKEFEEAGVTIHDYNDGT
jgi:hypothetical protein